MNLLTAAYSASLVVAVINGITHSLFVAGRESSSVWAQVCVPLLMEIVLSSVAGQVFDAFGPVNAFMGQRLLGTIATCVILRRALSMVNRIASLRPDIWAIWALIGRWVPSTERFALVAFDDIVHVFDWLPGSCLVVLMLAVTDFWLLSASVTFALLASILVASLGRLVCTGDVLRVAALRLETITRWNMWDFPHQTSRAFPFTLLLLTLGFGLRVTISIVSSWFFVHCLVVELIATYIRSQVKDDTPPVLSTCPEYAKDDDSNNNNDVDVGEPPACDL